MSTAYPSVDYDVHPAFESPSDHSQAERSVAFAALIARLDEILTPIRLSDEPLSDRSVRGMTKTELGRCIVEARNLLQAGQCAQERAAIEDALLRASVELPAEAAYRSRSPKFRPTGTAFDSRVATAIDEVGAFECHLDPAGKGRLRDLLEPQKRLIAVEAGKRYKSLTVLPKSGPEADLLLELLRDAGIPAGLEEFFNCPLDLHFWTLIRSDPSEVWWRDGHHQVGVPTSPNAYFHIDSGFDGPKVMVYLDDVGLEHGPFEYLPHSHRWQRSTSLELLNKQIERAHKVAWPNARTKYYRPYMQIEAFRQALMNLPTLARQQSHFGDDVLIDTELHAFLEQTKRIVCSDSADCVAFDGNRVAHRGSLATGATRWALQVGFEPRPTGHQAFVRRTRSLAGSVRNRLQTTA